MKSMKKLILCFLLLLLSNKNQFGQCQLDDDYVKLCSNIESLIFNENFADADNKINDLLKTHPNESKYHFLKSMLNYWKTLVFADNKSMEDEFLKSIENSINLASHEYEKDKYNACSNFILGAAYGYKGIYYMDHKSMFSAIKNASNGLDFINNSLKLNPSNIDCYYGLGIYNYNAGSANFLIRLILPIFFQSADKEKGIKYLESVCKKGKLSKDNAAFTLALIYDKEGNYDKSRDYLSKLHSKYPNSSIFTVYLMQNYFNIKKNYKKVIQVGQSYYDANNDSKINSKRMTGMICFFLAHSYEFTGDYANALLFMEKYLNNSKNGKNDKHAREMIAVYKEKIKAQKESENY